MRSVVCGALLVMLVGSAAWGQDVQQATWGRRWSTPQPNCPPGVPYMPGSPSPYAPGTMPPGTTPPGNIPPGTTPPSTDPNAAQPPATDAFAQAGEGGTAAPSSFSPGFFGDLIGYSAAVTVHNPDGSTSPARRPVLARAGGYKIAENESPRPTNRVFYSFNYYNDVNHSSNVGLPPIDLFRHTLGFEKTLFNGNASVGMRLPFVNITSGLTTGTTTGPSETRISDLSIILKYAMYNNRETGDVFSGGLVLTVPTGGGIWFEVADPLTGDITQDVMYPVLFQPYAGWIRNFTPRLYAHGFHSFVFPTDGRDISMLLNDVGFGFWLYRNAADRFVQAIVPTFEFHLNTPLNHRGLNSVPIGMSDQLNLTCGAYMFLPRSVLGFAVGMPVLGPRPFDVEVAANFTLRF